MCPVYAGSDSGRDSSSRPGSIKTYRLSRLFESRFETEDLLPSVFATSLFAGGLRGLSGLPSSASMSVDRPTGGAMLSEGVGCGCPSAWLGLDDDTRLETASTAGLLEIDFCGMPDDAAIRTGCTSG